MAFDTGNPIGSKDPRDLSDNAENMDRAMNSPDMSWMDRLGLLRKTWAGLESEFYAWLADQGFESSVLTYIDGTPLVVQRPTQLIQRDGSPGVLFSVSLPASFPVTLTGAWATDEPLLNVRADNSLRADLSGESGGSLVGFGDRTVSQKLSDTPSPLDSPHSAAGDGATDDTAAFDSFEALYAGRPVDLSGRSYVVSAIPNGNAYYNGTWVVGGRRRAALLGRSFLGCGGRHHAFGGVLRDLREALGNPFHQYTGVVFIGDSITWGSGATGTNDPNPRDGTLSDPRDYFATASFVNEFKRYIGQRYAPLASPIISNHPASSGGESTVEYQREVIMYPRYGEITLTQDPAGSLSATDVINTSLIGGGQLRLTSGNIAIDISHTITFNFTGTDFRVYFSCVNADATFYELLVDGVSQGVFSMKAGAVASSGVVTDGQVGAYYDHNFAFVRDKVITIRTKRNGDAGNRVARFNAIRILKRIVVKNQGINGSSARVYGPYNLSGSFGDGVAVEPEDSFVFCQLGTNDRIIPGANQYPRGPNIFRRYLDATLNYLSADKKVILMVAPPTSGENPARLWLDMSDVRDTVLRCAKARTVDLIDNYSAFADLDMLAVSGDGVHPNDLGYAILVSNIIHALEEA